MLAGLFCGLAIGIRHIDAGLAIGIAVLLLAAAVRTGASPKEALRTTAKPLVLGLLWALLHALIHHQVAYGSLLSHEHFADEVWFQTSYDFLGLHFTYPGLLNWPFAEQVIRTPYNGLPTFLMIPLSLTAHSGSVFVALVAVGLSSLVRGRRALALALTAWALPIALLHLVLEDWLDPNKMGIPVTLQPVLAIGLVLGIRKALDRRRTAALTLGLSILLSLFARGARSIDVPDDPAFYLKYPLVRTEVPVYANEDRLRWTQGNFLPDWSTMSQHAAFLPSARLRDLWAELGDRDLRQGPTTAHVVAEPRGSQRLLLNLSSPLVGRRDFLQPAAQSSRIVLDLREEGSSFVVQDLDLPWADRGGELMAVHDAGSRVRVFLRFGIEDFGDFESVSGFTIDSRPRKNVSFMSSGGQQEVTLILPNPAVLEVSETVSLDQVLIYRWDGTATDGISQISDWRKLFHN
jgi:hypothetical protein